MGEYHEPWVVTGSGNDFVREEGSERRLCEANSKDIARRIVACVNFCAGYEIDFLEQNVLKDVIFDPVLGAPTRDGD